MKRKLLIFEKKKNKVRVIITGLMCLFLPAYRLAAAAIDSYYCARFRKHLVNPRHTAQGEKLRWTCLQPQLRPP
jgi:hypothetical protein